MTTTYFRIKSVALIDNDQSWLTSNIKGKTLTEMSCMSLLEGTQKGQSQSTIGKYSDQVYTARSPLLSHILIGSSIQSQPSAAAGRTLF